MDARKTRWAIAAVIIATWNVTTVQGATYRTPNFVVTAPTKDFAERVGKAAEYYRKELAVAWLGKELKYNWYRPCPITVRVGQIGAGGATSFQFDRGEVFGWKMNVQGTEERILDSVIPHEVSHMIFASHFRRPLPRWADEGAATLIEHESERMRQLATLKEVTQYGKRYSLRQLLSIKEYPESHQRVMTLYAQGYSLADYLIEKRGRRTFLTFLETAHHHGWDNALRHHYELKNIEQLEGKWDNWVMAGSPRLNLPEGSLVAEAETEEDTDEGSVVRGQSPETAGVELGAAEAEIAEVSAVEETAAEASTRQPEIRETQVSSSETSRDDRHVKETSRESSADSKRAGGLDDYQIRGRKSVVASGWEPVATGKPARTVTSSQRTRPPFAEDTSLVIHERPPFVEEDVVASKRERPPFVK